MSALLFSLLAQQAGELHIPDQRLLLLLLAQALLLLHELGIDGLGAELQRAEQVLQLPEVEDVLGDIFLALALCDIHRIGRLVQRSSGEDTAFHAKKKPTTRGQDDPNDISDKGKQTGQIRRRTCLDTKPTKQSKRSSRPDKTYRTSQAKIPSRPTKTPLRFRSDETVRTTGSNRSNGPDRLNERSAPTDESSGSGRTKRHGASSPPRHLPFHQPPKEPAGASFPRISRSLGTADGFPELSQPARHTNIPRLTSTTSIPAAMPQRTPHRKRRQNADGR